jgi:hemerythrin
MTVSTPDSDILWTDDFLIGIDELDFEHRQLLEDVNKLHQDLLANVDLYLVKTILGRIHARLQAHFALEETFMLDKLYTDYASHKDEHDQLLNEYTQRMVNYEKDPTLDNRKSMELTLRTWLVEHILSNDKKMIHMIESVS